MTSAIDRIENEMSAHERGFESGYAAAIHDARQPGSRAHAELAKDRLFVNDTRTVLARLWANGRVEVARRDSPYDTWGPPVMLDEERA